MSIKKNQHEVIYDALLEAYDYGDLQRMLKFKFDIEIEHIATGTDLREIIFSLVDWAERTGNTRKFIQAAHSFNPGNQRLKEVAEKLYSSEEGENIERLLQRIQINFATEKELESLPGIGPGRARLIINHRKVYGYFYGVNDLENIPGITSKLAKAVEPHIDWKIPNSPTRVSFNWEVPTFLRVISSRSIYKIISILSIISAIITIVQYIESPKKAESTPPVPEINISDTISPDTNTPIFSQSEAVETPLPPTYESDDNSTSHDSLVTPDSISIQLLDDIINDTEVHYVGVYEGNAKFDSISESSRRKAVEIKITQENQPLTIVLSAYEPVHWILNALPNVKLKTVIISGYYKQTIDSTNEIESLISLSHEQNIGEYFDGNFLENRGAYLNLRDQFDRIASLPFPTTIQGKYRGDSFVIDGVNTMTFPNKPLLVADSCVGFEPSLFGIELSDSFTVKDSRIAVRANQSYIVGKWYYEAQVHLAAGESQPQYGTNIGIISTYQEGPLFDDFVEDGDNYGMGTSIRTILRDGDVVGVAINLDDSKLFFSINGKWTNGDPNSNIDGLIINRNRDYVAAVSAESSSKDPYDSDTWSASFAKKFFVYAMPEGYQPYDTNCN